MLDIAHIGDVMSGIALIGAALTFPPRSARCSSGSRGYRAGCSSHPLSQRPGRGSLRNSLGGRADYLDIGNNIDRIR